MANYVDNIIYVCGLPSHVNFFIENLDIENKPNFIETILPPLEETSLTFAVAAKSAWGTSHIEMTLEGYHLNDYRNNNLKSVEFEAISSWDAPDIGIQRCSIYYPDLIFIIGSIEEQPCFAKVSSYIGGSLEKFESYFTSFEFDDSTFETIEEYEECYNSYYLDLKHKTFAAATKMNLHSPFLLDNLLKNKQSENLITNQNFVY